MAEPPLPKIKRFSPVARRKFSATRAKKKGKLASPSECFEMEEKDEDELTSTPSASHSDSPSASKSFYPKLTPEQERKGALISVLS